MFRLSFFIITFIIVGGSEAISVLNLNDYDIIHVVDNHSTCSSKDTERWANAFVNCFVNKKSLFLTKREPFNIVGRLLNHSRSCIKFATLACRPNYDGFLTIMGKVVEMIKEYSNMYVERLTNAEIITYAERADKIIDLNCVEESLTMDTYATCFSNDISAYEQLGENETYDLIYQKEVEMAIVCTNTEKRQCSKSVKIELNKIVRYILGVRQPEKEDIEDSRTESPRHTEPSKPQSGLLRTEERNIDDNSVTLKILDPTSLPEFSEFSETEKENSERNLKNTNTDFREVIIFNEKETILGLEISEKGNIKNDTMIPEHSEIATTPKPTELSKPTTSTMGEKPTERSMTAASTNPPKLTESQRITVSTKRPIPESSEFSETEKENLERNLKNTKTSKSQDFREGNHNDDHNGTTPYLSEETIIFNENTTILNQTKSEKENIKNDAMILEHSEIATTPKPTELSKTTTSTMPSKPTERSMTAASTNPPKLTERQRFTVSTKRPIPRQRSRTSASTKPPKPTERPRTTTTTKPRTSPSVVHSTSTFDIPRPTEAPRPWYDFIVRPFVSLWNTIKSWFGW